MLVTLMQHRQGFAHQLFILVQHSRERFNRLGVFTLRHINTPYHYRNPGALFICRGRSFQQAHRLIKIVTAHRLQSQFAVEMGDLDTLFIFTQLDQFFRHVDGFLPIAGCLVDHQQLLQRGNAEIFFAD
ncbi:hypothetical protein D3C78_970180 [compost metagenome]